MIFYQNLSNEFTAMLFRAAVIEPGLEELERVWPEEERWRWMMAPAPQSPPLPAKQAFPQIPPKGGGYLGGKEAEVKDGTA